MNHAKTEESAYNIVTMYKRVRHYNDLILRENRQKMPQQEKIDVYKEAIEENYKRIEELINEIRRNDMRIIDRGNYKVSKEDVIAEQNGLRLQFRQAVKDLKFEE